VSSRTVRFLDLAQLHASIDAELVAAFREIVSQSAFAGGEAVTDFEHHFAAAHGVPFGVGCASGTDALALALRAFGLGPGDEVIVPAMTFIATGAAVRHVGAVPVLADVDPTTLLLTEQTVEAVRTVRTRAVIPVHLYGHIVPFELLRSWRDSGLLVIEDAAQAHLATWHGMPVGTEGHASCFSFYPGKNLGALGDGGIVLTPDPAIAARISSLANHGRGDHYLHNEIGYCSRLDGLQAAFLDVKLRHLPEWTEARRRLADRYAKRLPDGTLVPWTEGAVHHLLVARVDDRESVQERLAAKGIQTGVHYPHALSQQPALAEFARPCPAAEAAAATVLSLPLDPNMPADDVDYVCDELSHVLAYA
jgi:dTDP-3-amino-3,4,6-trideoxy-alpha-D-glucose transaminase